MGINTNGLRFLLRARRMGVDFSATATIGRQGLHLTYEALCRVINVEHGLNVDSKRLSVIYESKYAEKLLEYLGAESVDSFDASPYEGSSRIHDFNVPLADGFHRKYTVVLDGGSLEHVFNFPVAVANCMQMLRTRGHFLGISPTNNQMGHGFYQFSPELFFRVFGAENGFRVAFMAVYEDRNSRRWFDVADPRAIGSRVGYTNFSPTDLLVMAEKLEDVPIFRVPPQQSDYVSAWNDGKKRLDVKAKIKQLMSVCLPPWLKMFGKMVTGRIRNPLMFRPVSPEAKRRG